MDDPILPEYVGQWAFTFGTLLAAELRHYYPFVKRYITASIERRAVEAENKVAEAKSGDTGTPEAKDNGS